MFHRGQNKPMRGHAFAKYKHGIRYAAAAPTRPRPQAYHSPQANITREAYITNPRSGFISLQKALAFASAFCWPARRDSLRRCRAYTPTGLPNVHRKFSIASRPPFSNPFVSYETKKTGRCARHRPHIFMIIARNRKTDEIGEKSCLILDFNSFCNASS